MKIDDHMVSIKKTVGSRGNRSPVVMIVTHGGLYAFFSKNNNGDIETLGMAPHKAIAAWMSEKKARDIKWNEGFIKSECNELDNLKKSKGDSFTRFRNMLFSSTLLKNDTKSEYYIVYDTEKVIIGMMHKNEIQKEIDLGNVSKGTIIRNVNLNEKPQFVSNHGDFIYG